MNAYLFIGIGIIMGWVMMRRTLYVFVVVLLAVILSACSEESSSKIYSDVPTTVEDNIDTSTEDGLAVEEKYTGNGSAWGSALFVNSSKIYRELKEFIRITVFMPVKYLIMVEVPLLR